MQNISRSEVLTMAHAIRRENPALAWGTCQRSAWKAVRLRAALRTGPARFTFTKENGEVREALGTLNNDLFQYEYKGSNRAESLTAIRFFDLEKNAFRSCKACRIIQVAA